ncbi:hypothetical protein BRADI_1g23824v3 [Brachypodium distachyon]|uniref:Uncharacterized protein n=1 Tax=Brachypodium distachyon TaxID=15368 RepID=A0A0Q3JU23_BRADI|nr:hypothetical protein BRADI_1g23824v3 [Brachypodium distachyon]
MILGYNLQHMLAEADRYYSKKVIIGILVDISEKVNIGMFKCRRKHLYIAIFTSQRKDIITPIHNKCLGISTKLVQFCSKSHTLIMDRRE